MELAVKSAPGNDVLSKIQNPSVNFLRPTQMVEHMEDIDQADRDLQNRDVQNKGAVMGRRNNLKKQFDLQAPQPITDGRVKDVLAKREKELREQITSVMLSTEEMRKNQVGAVDRYRRGEGSAATKKKILEWKKVRLALAADGSHPETWDRDVANIEQYRPSGAIDTFRTDAQITGKMNYTNIPQERWDAAFEGKGPENTALKQAERVAEETGKRKYTMTEEQKDAARKRLADAREKKRQMKSHSTDAEKTPVVEGELVGQE